MTADVRPLVVGEPAPWFVARSLLNPRFHISAAGGRVLVLCFAGSAASGAGAAMVREFYAHAAQFDGYRAALFVVSVDPADESQSRLREEPAIKALWDFDRSIAGLYGCADDAAPGGVRPTLVIVDRAMRIVAIRTVADGRSDARDVLRYVAQLPPAEPLAPAVAQAPVLVVERILEPSLCRRLIEHYEEVGGADSGYMQQIGERTVATINHSHKRRSDCWVDDNDLLVQIRARLYRRLLPEVVKAFQFQATRIERYIVACYDSQVGGYFRPHRDNTTTGTAHRRFAITINLNADEYEGGDLRFPEFGNRLFRAPTGGAVVFSCSLLHEAMPVTRGRRFAFLPFIFGEEDNRLRERNLEFVEVQALRIDGRRGEAGESAASAEPVG